MAYASYVAGEKLTAAKLNEKLLNWVTFNGTGTPAVDNSYNVSSITDGGEGNYTVVYSTNFVGTPCVQAISGLGVAGAALNWDIGSNAIGSVNVRNRRRDTGAPDDVTQVFVYSIGDRT